MEEGIAFCPSIRGIDS